MRPNSLLKNLELPLLLLLLLLLLSTRAWSCSCSGMASIEETIASSPILVEARVVSLEEVNSPEYGRQVHSATLQVGETLEGSVSSKTIIVEHHMCYASLYPELMKVQHTYVLPLQISEDGRYELTPCAHSGMELNEGKLYTFEQTDGAQRRLQFYKKYSDFRQKHPR